MRSLSSVLSSIIHSLEWAAPYSRRQVQCQGASPRFRQICSPCPSSIHGRRLWLGLACLWTTLPSLAAPHTKSSSLPHQLSRGCSSHSRKVHHQANSRRHFITLTARGGDNDDAGPNGRCVINAQASSDSPRRIFQVIDAANVILENLELINGFLLQTRTEAETNLFGDSGAALLVAEWSCVTAVECVFSNNRAVRCLPSLSSHSSVTTDVKEMSTTVWRSFGPVRVERLWGLDVRVRSEPPQYRTCQCYVPVVVLGALGFLSSGP